MSLPPKPEQPKVVIDNKAINLFNEMSYEILVRHPSGKKYLRLLEELIMRPVYIFGKKSDYAAGRQGYNNCMADMINGAHKFMNDQLKNDNAKKVTRTRKG